ncbi:hypothetical protein [Bacillus sp. FSL K6-3431]|uniref:hypothetical protein n=1 Tax=Bacillus sp. FSL K6-3431 TaxID=2921500 RepID=UPI0030FB8CB0
MKIVQVIDISVRYNGVTYRTGEFFEMEDEHVNETLVKITGEVEQAPKSIEEMTVPELKEYAAENDIDFKDAKKKEEILEAIRNFENDEPEGNDQEGDE